MKVLFLSFDGVLKSENSFIKHKEIGVNTEALCKEALFNLSCLISKVPSLKIVLTGPEGALEPRELKAVFYGYENIVSAVMDSTPKLRGQTRGDEIRRYLMHTARRISHYAVLDCEADVSVIDDSLCVITDRITGLTKDDIANLYKILR